MIPYVNDGTYLFRFMDHRAAHFWPAISDMLGEQLLFLNSRTNFNDPFDSQPVILKDLKTSAIRSYFNDMIQNPFNKNRSLDTISKILKLKSQGKVALKKDAIDSLKEKSLRNAFQHLDECGLLSFSLTAENPLLWGHYAASFAGICAVFKRNNSTKSVLSICSKVTYVTERPELPLSLVFALGTGRMSGQPIDDVANRVFFLSFLHKDANWASEQEARVFYPFSAFKKMKFEAEELVGFILGPRSPAELRERLRREVIAKQPNLAVHDTFLSPTKFKITIPQQFLRP